MRVVSPSDLTDGLVRVLTADRGVLNLVVLRGRASHPDGDAIECDVLNSTANTVLRTFRRMALDERGSIVIEPVELAISAAADEAEDRQPGRLARVPVWETVEARIRAGGSYAPSFYLYLVIAGVIGAVGILTNSQILIVAAMVVGPEYGAIGGRSGMGCGHCLSASWRRSWPRGRSPRRFVGSAWRRRRSISGYGRSRN